MTSLTAYEIGEDGGMWLVVGQIDVSRESISVAEARLAVIALLREQLLPADEEAFMSETLVALDAPASIHWSAIYSDPKTERVYTRSPIGGTPIWGDRIGTCAVAIGFDLPDHRTVSRELGNHDEQE